MLKTSLQSVEKDTLDRRNLSLGLVLGAVALAFFCGCILRAWWLG